MWNEQNNQNSGNYQYGNGNQPYNGMNNNQYNGMNNAQYNNQSYNNMQNNQYNNQNYNTGMMNSSYGNMQNGGQYNNTPTNNMPQYNNLSNTAQYGNLMNTQYGQYNGMNNQPNMPVNNAFNGYQFAGPAVKPKRNKNKKLLITIGVIIVIILIVLAFFFLKGNKKEKKPTSNSNSTIVSSNGSNYEEVMNEYGLKAEEYIKSYKDANGKFPDMVEVTDNVKVDYKVYCDEKIIYPDGALYLNKCSINASDSIYTYGNPREENKLMKEYGALALAYVSDYNKVYGDIPTTLNVEYDGNIVCDVVNIYDVNNIYLDQCSVNGSEKIYSYGYQKNKGFVYIAYTQLNSEVYGENTTAYYESDSANSKVIKCSTLNCSLDKYLGKYVAIKESNGKTGVYDITSSSEDPVITVDKDVTYTFIRDGDTSVYGLFLKNAKNQEALFTFYGKQYVYNYGKYYFDWTSNPASDLIWDRYPLFAATNLIVVRKVSGNKYGLVNLKTRKEVIPCENDMIFMKNKQLHVVKGNKTSLYNSTGSSKRLKGKSYDALAVSNYNNYYTMVYGSNLLEIVDIDGKLIKKVADIPATYTLLEYMKPYESIKLVDNTTFQVVFKTNKTKTSCARYSYDMQSMKLVIDEKECSYFSK